MYTVAGPDPDPNPRGEVIYLTLRVQFYANEWNEGETLTPYPNECNSTLMSRTSGGAAPNYTIYTGEWGQLPNPNSAILRWRVQRGERS